MAKYKAYPKYKESGIDWIGDIPEGWEVNRVYSVFDETNLRGGSKETLLTVTQKEGILPQAQYQEKTGKRLSQQASDDYSKYKRVQQNDLIYNKMRMWQGAIGATNFDGCVSPAYVTIRSKKNIVPSYWENLFKTPNFLTEVNRFSQGICDDQNSCNFDNFREIPITIPPLHEQQAIANFLDRETAHIDALIAKKERSIELLKEKRQATITHAITKGLNPQAKMKDSGIEWVEEMPCAWEVKKIKHLFVINKRIAKSLGFDILSITQQGIKIKDISKNEGQVSQDYSKYQLVYPNDFVMNHMDLLTGGVDCSKTIGVTSPDYRVFTACSNSEVCNNYFLYLFLLCYKQKIFYSLAQGVSHLGRCRLQTDVFLNTCIPKPTLSEQQAIADYLDAQCAKLDTLISKTQRSIALLKEKRSTLITAAVTGKIDVREAVC